jgi:glycerol-3-phosphate dehydrogenase
MSAEAQTQRPRSLRALADKELDLLVVGGGIVGAGVARDAALRGLSVGLVDRHDFAFGTSSRSSRLLHGGIRYLAQGKIALVREASREKRILHRIAPHLAVPLAFVFPAYHGSGWPLWQLRLGVRIYDLLCGGRNLGTSSVLSRAEASRLLPALNGSSLSGAVRYFDGFTNDSRLVLDTLRSAVAAGAQVANYARFINARRSGGRWLAEVRDEPTGGTCQVRSRAIINATGPWADKLPHSGIRLRCTKGIHLVLDRNRLPVRDAVVFTEGRRILFVIPWGERVVLGTTDTDYQGAPEDVLVDSADVAYVLHAANQYFPAARLALADIINGWAGVRPLLDDRDGNPSDISRSHLIQSTEPGWWDVAGGKLTTYRLMAEQTVDQVVSQLGFGAPPSTTAWRPLLPAGQAEGVSGVLPPPIERATVAYYCCQEWVIHLDDVMTRRTNWRRYHQNSGAIAIRVLDWMGEILGWTESQKQEEWAAYQRGMTPWESPAPHPGSFLAPHLETHA